MSKERPDYHDAKLHWQIYDIRRESVMRESRNAINAKFWPKSYQDVLEVINKFDHPLNAAWRQTSSYWEMVYGMAVYGIMNADYLIENNGEGLFLFAKVKPYLEQLRKDVSPLMFKNAEWITQNCDEGKRRFELVTARVKKLSESMK